MWNDGILWMGPRSVTAGSQGLHIEMDLLSAPLKNNWSVIVFGSVSKIDIAHSDGYASDAWPV